MSESITTTNHPDRTGSALLNQERYALAAVGVMLAAHVPLLLRLGRRMWAIEHYQFFPLILIGAGYLSYQRWEKGQLLRGGRGVWRVMLAGASALMLMSAILLDSPWVAAISAMVALWTGIYLLGGRSLLVRMLPAWAFLLLAVPLPMGLDAFLIMGLQRLATQWASGVLDLFGYRHVVAGVVLELPRRSFLVEEACSGIHSLFAAITCTAFYSIQLKRGLPRFVSLLLATIFWVLVVNATRVTLVTVLCSRWDLPIADGIGHDMVGVISFATSLLMIASSERCLLLLFPYPFELSTYFYQSGSRRSRKKRWWDRPWFRRKSGSTGEDTTRTKQGGPSRSGDAQSDESHDTDEKNEKRTAGKRRSRPKTSRLSWLETVSLAVVFAALGIAQFAMAGVLGKVEDREVEVKQIAETSASTLPTEIAGWKQADFQDLTRNPDDPNGEFSRLWYFEKGDDQLIVSIDGPFVGWHNLTGCFEGQGWKVVGSEIRKQSGPADQLIRDYVQMQVDKGLGQHATVLYAVFDQQNRAAIPAGTYASFRAIRRFPKLAELLGRMSNSDDQHARPDSTTYQVQVYRETTAPLARDEIIQLDRFFHSVLSKLVGEEGAARD